MTRATLSEVLSQARADGFAVAGVVCLGWEDARAYTLAAQAEGLPIILQAGPGARAHMPLPIWACMFAELAAQVEVPVVSHLDHGQSVAECLAAIELGFSSVMFDGSALPLAENIAQTSIVAQAARAAGVGCEGEIGYVGYAEGAQSKGTDPIEAAQFAHDTGVNAMAVSVGNVHLQKQAGTGLDLERIAAIRAMTNVPLVIHGGSGVPIEQRADLARRGDILKFNIGTELRQVFGSTLRKNLNLDSQSFDRVSILSSCEPPLIQAARHIVRGLAPI